MNLQLTGLVLIACAGLCSAGCSQSDSETVKPMRVLKDVGEVPLRYKPEQLFDILGFSLKPPQWEKVIDVLAATEDKCKPNTIANKYTINDLLAMNEVYERDFTAEKFREKVALCESLSPEKVGRPTESVVSFLIDMNRYTNEPKSFMESKQRKPLELVFYKNLFDYCQNALDLYHYLLWANLRVADDELDQKAEVLRVDLSKFLNKRRRDYKKKDPRELVRLKEVSEAFQADKQPAELAATKEMCSNLISRVEFMTERKLKGHVWHPLNYDLVYIYCKASLGQQ